MREAIARLSQPPQALLLDAVRLPTVLLPQRSIIKGDALCLSIAAASIIAKVTRDRLMLALHEQYPLYGFSQHKGYGTEQHLAASNSTVPAPFTAEASRPCANNSASFPKAEQPPTPSQATRNPI